VVPDLFLLEDEPELEPELLPELPEPDDCPPEELVVALLLGLLLPDPEDDEPPDWAVWELDEF
jgi:hypothetical protein